MISRIVTHCPPPSSQNLWKTRGGTMSCGVDWCEYNELFLSRFPFRNSQNPFFSRACGAKFTVLPLEKHILMIFWRAAGGFFGNLLTDFPLETAILESRKVKIFRPPEAAKILDPESGSWKQGGGGQWVTILLMWKFGVTNSYWLLSKVLYSAPQAIFFLHF